MRGARIARAGEQTSPGGPRGEVRRARGRRRGPAGTVTGSGNGRQQVTVAADETNFTTSGCGYWEEAGAPQTFIGTASQVTSPFTLEPGLAIAAGTHSGDRNFIVQLVDAAGDTVDYLANEIGAVTSESLTGELDGGSYRLEVMADGPWSITVTQPKSVWGRALPTTFSGTGNGIAGPFFQSDRAVVFDAQHTGERNFIVQLVDTRGNTKAYVANEIGDASVSSIERLDGTYWVSVMADGPWSITARY